MTTEIGSRTLGLRGRKRVFDGLSYFNNGACSHQQMAHYKLNLLPTHLVSHFRPKSHMATPRPLRSTLVADVASADCACSRNTWP